MTIRTFLFALSTLIGTIIGAGIFGIPFVVSKSGVIPGVFYFLLLGGGVLLLHLFLGEVCLRTTGKHRLIGYASKYLGVWAKALITFSTLFGVIGALLAYMIIGGDFLNIIFSSFISVPPGVYSVILWAVLSLFIVKGIQFITRAEFFMNAALFLVFGIIFFTALPHVELSRFSLLNSSHIFLPYGVILFALTGWSAIPEIVDVFKKHTEKRKLDNLIIFSSVITIVLYALFSFMVVGVAGTNTSEDALSGLIPFLGRDIIVLGALFGLIAVAASFLVLGNYLKNSLKYDYKTSVPFAIAAATLFPLFLFLLGFREFISVIGIVGIVVGVIEGIVIILLFQKAKTAGDRKPEYELRIPRLVLYVLGILLLGGAIGSFIL